MTFAASGCLILTLASAALGSAAPDVPAEVAGKDGVKQYLVQVVEQTQQAAADLKAAGEAYVELAQEHGGAVEAAASNPNAVADLVTRMRDAYERIDSFGYEYVEGIVAGVPSLADYDVELDSGSPRAGAAPDDAVADIVIHAGDLTLDHEGSLNNWLIEPTVFGTNPRFTVGEADLPGFDEPVMLPHPQLVVALADYAIDGYARLHADCVAWQPTDADCFTVLVSMTPTLAEYFEEWKEARKFGSAPGGRFVAVSRVSDMRGIMASTRLAWLALDEGVQAQDAALAREISDGYEQILGFIDDVDAREQAQPLSVEAIDALGSQARQRADKVTVQAAQAAALVGIDIEAQ